MTTLTNIRIEYHKESRSKLIRYARNTLPHGLPVSMLIKFGNKPRGRAVKVANRLINLDVRNSIFGK